jgi:signal transduction histidine kinase
MSLRTRLALAFFLLAAGVGLASLLGGYLVFRGLVERDTAQDLAETGARVARALVLTEGGPRLAQGEPFQGSHYVFGFRLFQGEEAVLEGGFLPQEGEAWRVLRTSWEGYRLEVYLRVEEYARALRSYLQASLLLLLPLLGLSALLGYAFAGVLARPLEGLSKAVESLSALRFPPPLPPAQDQELARLARGFNRMADAVRAALERERLFTRHASHELRSPLAVLRSQLEALAAGLLPPEQALPRLEEAVARMERTLEGLLALARDEKDLAPLELSGFLRAYLEPHAKTVRLEAQGPAWVLAQPALLERLLDNLLENALRHGAPPVEVRLLVRGAASPPGEHLGEVLLEVRDHGPGVREEDLPRLTQPFFRGSGGKGLGLGLALAEEIARRLGGGLEVENAHPGLRVRLRLPRWRDEAA